MIVAKVQYCTVASDADVVRGTPRKSSDVAATSGKFGILAAYRAEVRDGMQNLLPCSRPLKNYPEAPRNVPLLCLSAFALRSTVLQYWIHTVYIIM